MLIEIEATVNAKPLTYISDDPENLLILTPSHFLTGVTNVYVTQALLQIQNCLIETK